MIIAVCDPKGIAIEAIKTILYHDKGLSDRISRIYEFWNMEQLLDASRDSSFDCIVFPNYCNSHNSVVCSLSCGYNRFPLVEHDPRYTLIVRDILYWETARSLWTQYLKAIPGKEEKVKLRQENGERERQKQAAEKKIKAAQYKQKRYEDEVIRCLDGQSRFSEEMLARLIAEAETEVRQAKEEYAELLRNDTTRATIQQIRSYYDEFLGWANEFDLATIPRKRAILGQLIEKVEVGKGYKVTVHLRMSYAQFLGIEGNGEIQVRKDVCA